VKTIENRPILWRYFITARAETRERFYDMTEDDVVIKMVFDINRNVDGAFVFSSGKDMGIFKGVGYPEDLAKFYRIEQYDGYLWTAHGRFPTNTPGWWGGAHPFGLLDWSIVHNGEISSYGINLRYLASFGYDCSLQTDTEVIAYLFDLMVRKHGLPLEVACNVMAPPLWSQIDRMDAEEQDFYKALRTVYAAALLNGPFSIVVGHSKGMIGLGDRVKLRPMVAARKGDTAYMASEESAILAVCDSPDEIWGAEAGQPIIARLTESAAAEIERKQA
jgi:glutamate synthase domain-containing protein 1